MLSMYFLCTFYVLSFDRAKERYQRKPAGVKVTVQNLLEFTAFDKLLTSFVEQYLRSKFSYGFFPHRYFNAGKNQRSEAWSKDKKPEEGIA